MKRKLIILLIVILFSCGSSSGDKVVSGEVLICGSKKAYAYHSHKCKGLSRCGSEIKKMSLTEAKKKGYKACGFCYK